MKFLAALLVIPALAGCSDFPKDQAGTIERVRAEGVVRVGLIASATPPTDAARLRDLVERTAREAGARPQVLEEAAEPLLLMLEEGELDLVVGEFDSASPWSTRVHLVPPLSSEQHGKSTVEATAAVRNGENGWTMLVERQARAISAR